MLEYDRQKGRLYRLKYRVNKQITRFSSHTYIKMQKKTDNFGAMFQKKKTIQKENGARNKEWDASSFCIAVIKYMV